jgi:hypothetical protein
MLFQSIPLRHCLLCEAIAALGMDAHQPGWPFRRASKLLGEQSGAEAIRSCMACAILEIVVSHSAHAANASVMAQRYQETILAHLALQSLDAKSGYWT